MTFVLQILQQTLQRATGESFEVIMGKGEIMHVTYQRNKYSFCRYEQARNNPHSISLHFYSEPCQISACKPSSFRFPFCILSRLSGRRESMRRGECRIVSQNILIYLLQNIHKRCCTSFSAQSGKKEFLEDIKQLFSRMRIVDYYTALYDSRSV